MIVAVLGGGQLGRMLALAGYAMGLRFRVLDPDPDACAGQVATLCVGSYDDAAAIASLVQDARVVTYEFENVPDRALSLLPTGLRCAPPISALRRTQDRLEEKRFFEELSIATTPFAPVSSRADLDRAVDQIGLPLVLKTRRLGYDGKGQRVVRQVSELSAAWRSLGEAPLLAEGWVPFERELSIVAVRGSTGERAFYSLVENRHDGGILRETIAPAAGVDTSIQSQAEEAAGRVLEALDYVGVLALELFQRDGTLLANEIAPRVHNSGHWSIEGAETSQFENHLRAILGWPLGSTAVRAPSRMTNLIGHAPPAAELAAVPGAHIHLYGKEPRPGRKVGHVTLCATSAVTLSESQAALDAVLAKHAALSD